MSQYWSPIVHRLSPYVPGEQPRNRHFIKLNTNENPYPPAPGVLAALRDCDGDQLRRYPDPVSNGLVAAIAREHQISQARVFVGNGSDEVLAHCFHAFFKDRELPLLFPDITYSFYPVYCGLYDIDFIEIPLTPSFEIDGTDYGIANSGIIFPNPNAPTGHLLTPEVIDRLCQWHRSSVIIVDEAYIDFGGESAIPLTERHENLLVVQTFSKSRALAGLRIGYAIGHPDLIEGLTRVKDSFNSYPLDTVAQAAGIASLQDKAYFQGTCEMIIDTRKELVTGLQRLGFDCIPSAANFVFAHHPDHDAGQLYLKLKQEGILVRHFKRPRIDGFLRITVGTSEQCDTLLEKLQSKLDPISPET